MDENLIGYVLDALDPDEKRRTEVYLHGSAEARRRLETLRSALAPLALVSDAATPPPGLVERTMARVAAGRSTRVVTPASESAFAPTRWRRIDVAVAAGILILIGGLGASGLARLHEQRERVRCQNNMREYYQSFANYAHFKKGAMPTIEDSPPHNYAGAFVPILAQSGHLAPTVSRDCPALPPSTNAAVYSYPLGYRDTEGRLHGLRMSHENIDDGNMPILADQPQSGGHGRGFNVLSLGGGVRHSINSSIGVSNDDIFMNDKRERKAGVHRLDSVLAAGDVQP